MAHIILFNLILGSIQLATITPVPASTGPTESIQPVSSREYWSEEDIKCLLAVYKSKKHLFDNNSIKNEEIWKTIEFEMEAQGVVKTCTQIKNKINNMKKTYKRAKDNDNNTGAAPSKFKYMECFEEMFGRDHDITPISYAESSSNQPITITLPVASPSSSVPSTSRSTITSPDIDDVIQPKAKRRKTNSESFMTYLQEMHEENKEYRKQRDEQKKEEREEKKIILKEAIEVMKEGNTIFKDMMTKIIDKI